MIENNSKSQIRLRLFSSFLLVAALACGDDGFNETPDASPGEDTGGKSETSAQIDPDSHATTTGMTGHGYYDANSQTQWNAIEAVLPMLDNAAARFPLQDAGVITFADYGCSEGRNSVAVMAKALQTALLRTALPVQTVHSDLPTN
ncbi:MAG: hypothetical protein AAGC55_11860, partial [Myxococcota bacterium]